MSKHKDDNERAPILEALREYHEDGTVPFSVPGHKSGRGVDADVLRVFGTAAFRYDMQQLGGFDDRTESKQVRQRAEALAARAWGSDVTRFSVNGSSLSAHVAVLAVAKPGEQVIIARNAHKSLIAATILGGVEPVFIEPHVDPDWDLDHAVTAAEVDAALSASPRARAVFIVSPDYYGVCADVKAVADVCHRHGVPLVVDEAWGTHLPFHPELPPSAMHAGADMSLGSVHKTMAAFSMASVLHLKGNRVSHERFEKAFDLFETTSPSSLILGAIDGTRRQHVLHGRALWGRALSLARRAREQIGRMPGLRVLGREALALPGAAALDETKILIDTMGLNVTGWDASDYLTDEHQIAVEMGDYRVLLAVITPGDDEASVDRLVAACRGLVSWARDKPRSPVPARPPLSALRAELASTPREAFFAEHETVAIKESIGRIAAEMISPYPPGISRVVPGQRITAAVVEWLERGIALGMFVQDAADQSLKTVRVVRT